MIKLKIVWQKPLNLGFTSKKRVSKAFATQNFMNLFYKGAVMKNSSSRRDFIANSAKLGVALGAVASLPLGAFAQNTGANSNSNLTKNSGANSTNSVVGTNKAIMQAKNGSRIQSKGYAAFGKDFKFKPYSFTRHALGEKDILIEILYAGICHSDLHSVAGDHHEPIYPIVPDTKSLDEWLLWVKR